MGLFPRLKKATYPLLAASLLLAAGCSKKTPEDQLMDAQNLLRSGQTSYAIVKFNDLIKQHPEADATIEARMNLMLIYAQQGGELNMTRAVEQARQIIAVTTLDDVRGQSASMFIAETYLRNQDFEAALAHLEAAQGEASKEDTKRFFLSVYNNVLLLSPEEEQQEKGREYFRDMMLNAEDAQSRGEAREVLVQHFRDIGRFEDGNAIYDLYLEKYPDDPLKAQITMVKALNLRIAGNAEASEALLVEGITLYKADIEEEINLERRAQMLMEFAQLLRQFEKYDEAEEAYRQVMRDQPMRPIAMQAQFGIGDMYASAGNWEKAEELFRAISRENAGTGIGQSADQALQMIAQYREQLAFESAAPPTEESAAAEDASPEETPAPAEAEEEAAAEDESSQ